MAKEKEKKVIKKIQEEFFKSLEIQTSWGKEQVKKLYLEVQGAVLMDELE